MTTAKSSAALCGCRKHSQHRLQHVQLRPGASPAQLQHDRSLRNNAVSAARTLGLLGAVIFRTEDEAARRATPDGSGRDTPRVLTHIGFYQVLIIVLPEQRLNASVV